MFDAFAKKLAAKVSALKVGAGIADGVTQGPLIDATAIEKIESHVADAVSKGAKLVQGGKPVSYTHLRLYTKFKTGA